MRIQRVLATLAVAFLFILVSATAASAHTGDIVVNCNTVTFSYRNFPSTPVSVNEVVTVNGTVVVQTTVAISGEQTPPATPIAAFTSGLGGATTTINAEATWTLRGQSFSIHQSVSIPCGTPATTTTTSTTVPETTSTTVPVTTTTAPTTTTTTVAVMPPGKKAPLPPTPVKAPEHATKVIGTTPTTIVGTAISKTLPMTGNGAAAEALIGGTILLAGLGLAADGLVNGWRSRHGLN